MIGQLIMLVYYSHFYAHPTIEHGYVYYILIQTVGPIASLRRKIMKTCIANVTWSPLHYMNLLHWTLATSLQMCMSPYIDGGVY